MSKITLKYIAVTAIAVALSWLLHELAHWATGELLGIKMAMTLNSAYNLSPYRADWEESMVSAGGPIFTLLQATLFFIVLRKQNKPLLYPFLFIPFYMRLLAGGLNFVRLNDEGRIGQALGIGIHTLSAIICAYLFYLVYHVSRRNGYSLKFNLLTLLLVIIFTSCIILGDNFLRIRLI